MYGSSTYGSTPFGAVADTGSTGLDRTGPMGTLDALGNRNYFDLVPPIGAISATGHDASNENVAALSAPSSTLSAFGGATATLSAPSGTLSIGATFVGWGSAGISPASPTLSATGVVSNTAYANLQPSMATLVGYSGAVISITTSTGTVSATGTTGGIGNGAVTLPLFQLTAFGGVQTHGSMLLEAPMGKMAGTAQAWLVAPGGMLTAIGSAVVTATYEAYAMNMKHAYQPRPGEQMVNEMTRYTSFPFTHIVRHQNSYFGVNSTGLYLLEGVTDDGAAIAYEARTAMTDFDAVELKTIISAYLGGRIGPAETITLYVGEKSVSPYSYTTPRGDYVQTYRQMFGRGIRSRYYALGVSGSAEFALDALDPEIDQLTRRI